MSDDGGKTWDKQNLVLMYTSLENVDSALRGGLKSFTNGTTFKLKAQDPKEGDYHGVTHEDGSGIDFYTKLEDPIRQMNIYHEIGHVLDNAPKTKDVFTNAVNDEVNPSWFSNGKVKVSALRSDKITDDPNYPNVQAIQAYNTGSSEVWADAFANYVAGNIDVSSADSPGMEMNNFVTGVLFGAP